MTATGATTAVDVRRSLGHPVVDVDGHVVESIPLLVETMAAVAGRDVADRFSTAAAAFASRQGGLLAAHDATASRGTCIAPWWAITADPLDRVTAFVPGLLHERMDELGLDFSVLYTSVGFACIGHPDDAIRRGSCRALNTYLAELCDGYGDRLTPAAVVPTHTPDEALDAITHAVDDLGLKAVVLNSFVMRPGADGPGWSDVLALDSQYDYGPVFAECERRGLALTVHSAAMGLPLRQSPTRYSANHIGHFAAAGEAFATALVYGGAAARHPGLRFAFLEGGVSWAVQLLYDLVARFDKRGPGAIDLLDPGRIDPAEWDALLDRWGGTRFADPHVRRSMLGQSDNPPPQIDDFSDSGVSSAEDIARLFDRFYFGCEADEPTVGWAYDARRLPGGRPLRPVLGSDIGHWDVPDMRLVLAEAYELVEDRVLNAEEFRAFTCDNPILLHGLGNPAFFDGTPVEAYARQLLGSEPSDAAEISGAAR